MNGFNDDSVWDAYNTLMCCEDIERMRKLLARYSLFMKTIHLPGDIVECGVFKGSGLMMFLKFLKIHCNGSEKRVIGFDFFGNTKQEVLKELSGSDKQSMGEFFGHSNFEGIGIQELKKMVQNIYPDHCTLVNGNICHTSKKFVEENPGMRISLLHMDLDVAKPTFDALTALWPRVVKGGIVILDEYAIAKWSESEAVDSFFKDKNVTIKTDPWMRTPSAYIIKT